MADPDPIDLTLKGKSAILVGQRADGKFIPVRVSNAGELLTSGGGGGGGDASAAKQDEQTTKLEEIAEQGRPGTSLGLLRFTAGIAAAPLSALATSRGITIQVVSTATTSVWIGTDSAVTAGGAGRGWEIQPGGAEWFDVANADQLWAIATSSVDCTARREFRP